MSLLRFRDETLGHGGRAVLSGVSLTLSPGERVVLLGRSGAGKSTLLAAMHDRLRAEMRVALVPQEHGLVPQLSAERNALMGRLDDHGAMHNLRTLIHPRAQDRAGAAAVLDELGLAAQAGQRVETLSGGQKQRVALARAFWRGGAVLIADEPVSALDETQGAQVLDRIAERFPTALVALHDVAQARAFATRIIGLARGRIVLDAAPGRIDNAAIAALYGG
ncbi:ATP-binding cassette domain-containing protein [Mangrovicoccus algicola]|uniref:ATP-binding cassette domain-containing protein n=1 Tax=Mangrovicoccus algicola TaxID=2771008 RepID=A0A8J7CTB1_9RHOB|nr:ATP-binding cassette domain-containing protein [Mangrovicoccus algicola]MBE3636824.1 ATP-binding cassette domain-containing protein [Mangrovicoccus algicola]